jgi:hypothetical protein
MQTIHVQLPDTVNKDAHEIQLLLAVYSLISNNQHE